jgi:hypothetical protein
MKSASARQGERDSLHRRVRSSAGNCGHEDFGRRSPQGMALSFRKDFMNPANFMDNSRMHAVRGPESQVQRRK